MKLGGKRSAACENVVCLLEIVLKEMLMSEVWRRTREVWKKEMKRKPKLSMHVEAG